MPAYLLFVGAQQIGRGTCFRTVRIIFFRRWNRNPFVRVIAPDSLRASGPTRSYAMWFSLITLVVAFLLSISTISVVARNKFQL